jgi:hypothetical protein
MAGEVWLGTGLVTQYDEDGFLGVQVEGHGGTEATGGLAYAHHPFGIFGTPRDAADGSGVVVLHWSDGDEVHSLILEDPRYASVIPTHSQGSCGICNSDGAYLLLDRIDKTAILHVPRGSGRYHRVTVGKDESGEEIITLLHADGAKIEIKKAEVKVTAETVHVNGATVLLGEAAGSPVACVGDIVVVTTLPLINAGGPVTSPAMSPTGGIVATGTIVSGRSSVKA